MVRYLVVLFILRAATAQSSIPGIRGGAIPPLFADDAAVLESKEIRADLPCTVKPTAPRLGFDMRFHSGYDVSLPMSELIGQGNRLTALFRVTPEDPQGDPAYFVQRWTVPPIADDTRGRAELHGAIVLGPGKYRVEWLLRDQSLRICATHWQFTVDPRGREKQVPLQNIRGLMQSEEFDDFTDEAPVIKQTGQSLKVLVLFHAAPRSLSAVSLNRTQTQALLAVLRKMAQEPRIGAYSVIAFNLDQAAVLYQRHDLPQIDFPALGEALKQIKLGTVDAQKLRQRDSEAEFLGKLLSEELSRSRPDALIFVGPRTTDFISLSRPLKELGEPQFPVFYVNYTPDPIQNPWRDAIGSLVKLWKGSEYIISKPPDVVSAWNDIMSRITVQPPSYPGPNAVSAFTGSASKK